MPWNGILFQSKESVTVSNLLCAHSTFDPTSSVHVHVEKPGNKAMYLTLPMELQEVQYYWNRYMYISDTTTVYSATSTCACVDTCTSCTAWQLYILFQYMRYLHIHVQYNIVAHSSNTILRIDLELLGRDTVYWHTCAHVPNPTQAHQ